MAVVTAARAREHARGGSAKAGGRGTQRGQARRAAVRMEQAAETRMGEATRGKRTRTTGDGKDGMAADRGSVDAGDYGNAGGLDDARHDVAATGRERPARRHGWTFTYDELFGRAMAPEAGLPPPSAVRAGNPTPASAHRTRNDAVRTFTDEREGEDTPHHRPSARASRCRWTFSYNELFVE